MVLDSARRASNEKNYPLAVQRYREYLQKFAGNKEANQARYGLALALIEGPTREYGPALEQLNPLAGIKELPELPYVLYYQGLCNRGLGNRALAFGRKQNRRKPITSVNWHVRSSRKPASSSLPR